jgi:hypothetical protein
MPVRPTLSHGGTGHSIGGRQDAGNACDREPPRRRYGEGAGVLHGHLELSAEGLDLGWVVRLSTPDGKAVVQLVTRDATAAEDPVVSVAVGADVDQVCSAGSSEWPTMLITNQKPNSQHSGSSSPAYSLTRPTATRRLLPISSRER